MVKSNKRKVWLLMIAVFLTAIMYLAIDTQTDNKPQPQYEIEKKGAGAVIDFTASSQQLHQTVDDALHKQGLKIRNRAEAVKETPRNNVEGTIRWHTRQTSIVASSAVSVEKIKQTIKDALGGKGQILAEEADTYQGVAAIRLDIGLKDKLEGEDLTIISDRIYILKESIPPAAAPGEERPAIKGRAQLAIVIDDFGYSREPIEAFAAISRPITFAVLPYRPYSNEAAARGLSSSHEVILHLPMEPLGEAGSSEASAIMVGMDDVQIREITQKAVQSLPGIRGVNNHQGSKATADRQVMKNVMQVLKSKQLFFLDSRTNSQSIAGDTARQMGVHTADNQLFIDNVDDIAAVKKQIRTAKEMALHQGNAIIIGHARMNTAAAVRSMIPELENSGVQLVFLSQLVQ